MVYVPESSRD